MEALLVRPNRDPPFDPEDRLSDPYAVLQILPGLVSILEGTEEEFEVHEELESDERVEVENDSYPDRSSEVVELSKGHPNAEVDQNLKLKRTQIRLAHFSVKEYLIGNNIGKGSTAVFGTTPKHANQFITESCLVYILAYQEAEDRTDWGWDLERFPLLNYSCSFWYVHRRAFVGEDEMPTGPQTHADGMIRQILLSIDRLRSWLRIHLPGKQFSMSGSCFHITFNEWPQQYIIHTC